MGGDFSKEIYDSLLAGYDVYAEYPCVKPPIADIKSKGFSQLMYAITRTKNSELIKTEIPKHKDLINWKANNGWTLLMMVCVNSNFCKVDIIQLLIDNGANINDVNNEGLNALPIFIKYILAHHKNLFIVNYFEDICGVFSLLLKNSSNINGLIDNKSILNYLISNCADIPKFTYIFLHHKNKHDKIDKSEMSILLQQVVKTTNNTIMVKILLAYGAEFDDSIYNDVGCLDMFDVLNQYKIIHKLNSIESRLDSLEEQFKNKNQTTSDICHSRRTSEVVIPRVTIDPLAIN